MYFKNCVQLFITMFSVYTVNGKISVKSEVSFCTLQDNLIWDVYYDHLKGSQYVLLKVLTVRGQEASKVLDFTTSIVQIVGSLGLPSTLELIAYDVQLSQQPKDFSLLNIRYKPKKHYGFKDTSSFRIYLTEQTTVCIIIVHDVESSFEYLLNDNNIFSQIGIRYLIVFTKKHMRCNSYSNTIGLLLVKLWKKWSILNVIANTACSCHPNNFYIYRPFRKLKHNKLGLVEIQSANQVIKQKTSLINQARNLHGIPLKITVFERDMTMLFKPPRPLKHSPMYIGKDEQQYYGADGMIINELSKHLNFTVKSDDDPINAFFGKLLQNGTGTGSLGKVIRNEVDLAGNSRFIEYYHPNFEYTHPIFADKLCIIVPNALKMPKYLTILFCFDLTSWVVIILTIVAYTVIWNMHIFTIGRKIADLMKIVWIFMGVPVNIPKQIRFPLLIIVCSFGNMIFVNLFQVGLYTFFSRVAHFANIKTLDELAKSNLPISTTFDNLDFGVYNILHEKVIDSSDQIEASAYYAAFYRNTSVLERSSEINLKIKKYYLSEDGTPLLYVLDECLSSYFIAYILRKGSPYKYYFNDALVKLSEAGIFNKWFTDTTEAMELEDRNQTFRKSENWKALNNSDFQIAYIVLALGYLISLLAFVREMVTK